MDWTISITPHMHKPIESMRDGLTKERNIRDGYIRGCGMYAGNILELCANDDVFKTAYRAARGLTLLPDVKLASLYYIVRFNIGAIPFGNIVEFGSYKGGSAIFMAVVAKHFHPGMKIYAFDTFEGMPPLRTDNDIYDQGSFSDVDLEAIRATTENYGLNNLILVKGQFSDTLPHALAQVGPISLNHIDCDLYESVIIAYEGPKSNYVPGCYLVFDDPLEPSCIGAYEAVEALVIRRDGLHAEQVFPHMIYRHPTT